MASFEGSCSQGPQYTGYDTEILVDGWELHPHFAEAKVNKKNNSKKTIHLINTVPKSCIESAEYIIQLNKLNTYQNWKKNKTNGILQGLCNVVLELGKNSKPYHTASITTDLLISNENDCTGFLNCLSKKPSAVFDYIFDDLPKLGEGIGAVRIPLGNKGADMHFCAVVAKHKNGAILVSNIMEDPYKTVNTIEWNKNNFKMIGSLVDNALKNGASAFRNISDFFIKTFNNIGQDKLRICLLREGSSTEKWCTKEKKEEK